MINPTRQEKPVTIEMREAMPGAKDVWGNQSVRVDGRRILLNVGDRDAAVVKSN